MSERSIRPGLVMALVLAGSLAAAAAQAPEDNPATPPVDDAAAPASPRALIASGDAPDLFLLYTGDVIGYLDPCG